MVVIARFTGTAIDAAAAYPYSCAGRSVPRLAADPALSENDSKATAAAARSHSSLRKPGTRVWHIGLDRWKRDRAGWR